MSSRSKHRRVLRDNIYGISRNQMRRIGLKTGNIGSMGSLSFEEIRIKLRKFLDSTLRDAITHTEHSRRRTVSEDDIRFALERRGGPFNKKILGSPPTSRCATYESSRRKSRGKSPKTGSKKRKASRGVSLVRRIRFYQKQHDCVHLPKLSTERVIREVAQDFKNDLRFSSKAINLMRYALELYIENVLRVAGFLSINRRGKGRVTHKDIQAVQILESLL